MDRDYYRVEVAGVVRDLPLFEVAPGLRIAIFNMLGDTEVVEAAADALLPLLPEMDVLVTPEVKAIPLAHALAARLGKRYVVARKILKPYMVGAIETEVVSITTGQPQPLYIDGKDLPLLRGKRVVLVDDVVSTGSTLRGLHQLMDMAGAEVVGEAAVFTEGDREKWNHIIALGHLPLFKDE